ncbi:LptA/OstA family protein [Caulobacter sp.]|uniref:LptA/OstA family protein n=1 Tax=Caulobacter sp. TaxID=78 RepID=UPI003BA8BC6A
MKQRWMAAAAMTALILASGGAAFAQIANDSSAPVDISADQQENINSQCRTIFSGNVEMLQDKSRMRASVVNAYSKRKPGQSGSNACGDVDHIEADGDVYFVNQTQTVRGDHAVYTYANDTIVITGNVIVLRGQDVARGDRMTVNTKTNDVKLESNTKGRGKPGRVRSVIYPDDSKDQQPAAGDR